MTTTFDLSRQIARRVWFIDGATGTATGERRQLATRCAGCDVSGGRFVFMSNGGDYCASCARGLAEASGYGPVGMRADDIELNYSEPGSESRREAPRGWFLADGCDGRNRGRTKALARGGEHRPEAADLA